jgi:polyisoprenoid-binding protein YceI
MAATLLKCVLGYILIGLTAVNVSFADTYALDKGHTQVAFAWERVGLSRQQGRFTDTTGTVSFDPARPEDSRVEVSLRASSLQTGVEALDRHLRSADFFDAAQYPTITFKSTAVVRTGDKTGEMTGDLTMLGVTKPGFSPGRIRLVKSTRP